MARKRRPFTIATRLDRREVERLGGRDTLWRGEDYRARGHVASIAEVDGAIVAKVKGNAVYEVRLSHDGKTFAFACTCPFAAEGDMCKHVVAVALTIIGGNAKTAEAPPSRDDVQTYLEGLPKAELVRMIVERTHQDGVLRDHLAIKAVTAAPDLNPAAIKRTIERAIDVGGFVDWRAVSSYADGVEVVVDSLAKLVDEGHGEPVIDLVEHALARLDEAMGHVDDDGQLGPPLERLQQIHLDLCLACRPDPVVLARRLFAWEMTSGFGLFYAADEKYAVVFGDTGIAEYRRLACAAWDKLPGLGPSWRDDPGAERFKIAGIMERLARQTGDVEALVAVLVRDLSEPFRYLRIAEAYAKAGDDAKACKWAEKGLATFPKNRDRRLVDFLVELHTRMGQHEDALRLAWERYVAGGSYETLRKRAVEAGVEARVRDEALAHVRALVCPTSAAANIPRERLVEIHLAHGEHDDARAEAKQGGCRWETMSALATAVQPERPEEAADIYVGGVEPALAAGGNHAYGRATHLMETAAKLYLRAGRRDRFAEAMAAVRARHARKRNLLAMLDALRW